MISNYITYITSIKGYSPLTAKSYEKDLKHIAAWARENMSDARWSKIDRSVIDRYIIDAEQNEQAPATTNRRLSALSGLYKYMQREGYKVENPCRYESRRKVAQRVPNTINPQQLHTAYENSCGATRVMLGILITTGIRIGELLALDWHDVDIESQVLTIKGKGNKERVVRVPAEQLTEIAAVKAHTDANGRMFGISQRMARRMIYDALKPYCSAEQLSPHAIRHTFATHLAAAGENVSTIGAILGHKHLETTQQYIDLAAAQNRNCNINNSIIK